MKTVEQILKSGIIKDVKFGHTIQSEDSNVWSFRFETTDEDGHWSIYGYVQKGCKSHNAIINGEGMNAFDCFITKYED